MSTEPLKKKPSSPSPVLEFKSGSFSAPILVLFDDDIDTIEAQLQQKIKLAPEFFKNSPVIFDVQQLNKQDSEIDVTALIGTLRKVDLLPIGIRGGNQEQIQASLAANVPVYSIHNSVSPEAQKPKSPALPNKPKTGNTATLINHPIRSGQRIYAAGDLIVTAQVSAGAEIMAEGNIHVYNTLRGRALAGVQGDTGACIFCFDLQAELISIAGNYKISEDLSENVKNKPVQIYLQEHTLIIKDII